MEAALSHGPRGTSCSLLHRLRGRLLEINIECFQKQSVVACRVGDQGCLSPALETTPSDHLSPGVKARAGPRGEGQGGGLGTGYRDSSPGSLSCSRPPGFSGLSPPPGQDLPSAVRRTRRTHLSKLAPPQARPGHSITEEAEGVRATWSDPPRREGGGHSGPGEERAPAHRRSARSPVEGSPSGRGPVSPCARGSCRWTVGAAVGPGSQPGPIL